MDKIEVVTKYNANVVEQRVEGLDPVGDTLRRVIDLREEG